MAEQVSSSSPRFRYDTYENERKTPVLSEGTFFSSAKPNTISLRAVKKHSYDISLSYLRSYHMDEELSLNQFVRGEATSVGNNCLLDTIFQQLPQHVRTFNLTDFVNEIRTRIGKTKGEQLSINDEEEGIQILSAIQYYLSIQTQKSYHFVLTVLFADNEGHLHYVDMEGIGRSLGSQGEGIPLRIILVNYNHYEPLFPKNQNGPLSARVTSISTSSQQGLPAYVVNMPMKVESDDEGESSSEEDNHTFRREAFQNPSTYFRLLPKDEGTGSATQRGALVEPFLSSTRVTRSVKKGQLDSLLPLFQKEISHISSSLSPPRIGISIGFNKMRSLSSRSNRSLQICLNEELQTDIPMERMGFFWEGIWQEFLPTGGQWRGLPTGQWIATTYARVRSFYKQLKKINRVAAETFRKKTEKRRAHMVPYREIRDVIKNSEQTKKLVQSFRKVHPQRDVYICFLDSDIQSFHHRPNAPGAFSVFDENYLASRFEIGSVGYTIKESQNLFLEVAVLADMTVRQATSKYVRRGVYYPEPCTAVKVLPNHPTVQENFSDPADRHYESPQEMPRLMNEVLKKRRLVPEQALVFDTRGAIVTTCPTRMEREFSCQLTQRNGFIFWGLSDFKTMRDVNQSHYNARDWALNLLPALVVRPALKVGKYLLSDQKILRDACISLLSRLFNTFDPVEIAKRISQQNSIPFQSALIRVLNDYESALTDAIPVIGRERNKRKPRKNAKDKVEALKKSEVVNTFWEWVDQPYTLQTFNEALKTMLARDDTPALIEAARESGREITKLFVGRLCLNYEELILTALAELIEQTVENIQAISPLYLKVINGISLTQTELLGLKNVRFYGIGPLHIAALAGNLEVINRLKEGDPETFKTDQEDEQGLFPLDYALVHCQKNGINVELLLAVCNKKYLEIEPMLQRKVIKTISDNSDKALVLSAFVKTFGEQIISDFDEDVFIEAILGDYSELANIFTKWRAYHDVLFDAIWQRAPDINDRLMEWAHKNVIERVKDQLNESDLVSFNLQLGLLGREEYGADNDFGNDYDPDDNSGNEYDEKEFDG